ncbi:General transcription factor II-I repeat domain-containing protein 2 [Dictyocoela muelleri]|nr:General transcription factor II-I repeat domain-containing protein 2 [Dictyocoela muelleri]
MFYITSSSTILFNFFFFFPSHMSKIKIKKINEEKRLFNKEWETQFYLIFDNDKMVCLLCDAVLSTIKKYNANQHYKTHPNHKLVNLDCDERKEVVRRLKTEKLEQKKGMTAFIEL